MISLYLNHMNDKEPLSIKDIARLSGVSVATVSHVINKKGRYSQETADKVNRIINRYGYRMNNAAKSLKSSSSHTIGLIIPNINNNFFSTIATETEHYFDAHDYSLFICTTDNDPEKEIRYFRKLDAMMVDGILCVSSQRMLDSDLLNRDIPVLLIDRTPANNKNYHIVDNDNTLGIYKSTCRLIELGCRNIIFISGYLASYVPTSRKDGYLRAMNEHHLHAGDDTIIQMSKGVSLELAEIEVINYIQKGNPVDGIVCTSDNQAIGAMTGLKRLGIRIPEDVKVIGFDNQFQSRICTPTLSTLERDPYQIGTISSENLLRLIRGETDVPRHVTLDTYLIERESTLLKKK